MREKVLSNIFMLRKRVNCKEFLTIQLKFKKLIIVEVLP